MGLRQNRKLKTMTTTKNFFLDQGSTFSYSFTAVDENNALLSIVANTGYTASGQMRRSYYSTGYVAFDVSLTGGPGGILIGVGATASAALKPGRYVYDIELLYPTGKVVRQRQGTVTVDPEATK